MQVLVVTLSKWEFKVMMRIKVVVTTQSNKALALQVLSHSHHLNSNHSLMRKMTKKMEQEKVDQISPLMITKKSRTKNHMI